EGPAVIAAGKARRASLAVVHDQVLTVRAYGVKGFYPAALLPDDQDRGVAHLNFADDVGAWFGELFDPAHGQPRPAEHAFAFTLLKVRRDIGLGGDWAGIETERAGVAVFVSARFRAGRRGFNSHTSYSF